MLNGLTERFFVFRLFDGNVEGGFVTQEGCRAAIFHRAGYERHTLEPKQRRIRRQQLHRLEEEPRAADDAANGSTRLQEGTDMQQFLADGVAWQAQQHHIGIGGHLLRPVRDASDGAFQRFAIRRADADLLLPTVRTARQQTDISTTGSHESRHYVA